MEFFRKENWSRLPFPTPGDFPDPGKEINEIYYSARKIKGLSEAEEKIVLVDKFKKEISELEVQAQKQLETLNHALENLFEYIQDVVYFEHTWNTNGGQQEKHKLACDL